METFLPAPSSSRPAYTPQAINATRLVALFPPDHRTPLSDFKPVILAQEEALFFRETAKGVGGGGGQISGGYGAQISDVHVLHDKEPNGECVELIGTRVRIELPCRVRVPGLILHVRDIGRFCAFEAIVLDTEGVQYSLLASNKVSAIRIHGQACMMPLEMIPGWNILRMPLDIMMKTAFGKIFHTCCGVIVYSSVKLARIYFESDPIEDVELPSFLRTSKM